MKIIELKVEDKKEIGIASINDIHLGSDTCNVKAFQSWADEIKENGWYWIGLGDLTENSLVSSVGDVYSQTMSPQEQMSTVSEILKPIADYGLGMVEGNHESRSYKAAGFKPTAVIAHELNVPFCGYTLIGHIKVMNNSYKIMAHHTTGGGGTPGGKLNALTKMANVFPMMDLYMGGHTHADVSFSDSRSYINIGNGGKPSLRVQERRFSGCGSVLEYSGGYAEAKLLAPASMCQVVHFLGQRKSTKEPGKYTKPYRREVRSFS